MQSRARSHLVTSVLSRESLNLRLAWEEARSHGELDNKQQCDPPIVSLTGTAEHIRTLPIKPVVATTATPFYDPAKLAAKPTRLFRAVYSVLRIA